MKADQGRSFSKLIVREFDYAIGWRPHDIASGLHQSSVGGDNADFAGFAPLRITRNPKRFDIQATVRDPAGEDQTRVTRQTSSITVYEIADLSASIDFTGRSVKRETLAGFSASLAYSVYRRQDHFGFIGCDSEVRDDFVFSPSRRKEMALEIGERLLEYEPRGKESRGLLKAADFIRQRRSLIFLVSDFYFPPEMLKEILEILAVSHEVVPVMIVDSEEFENMPPWGFAWMYDPESGQKRLEFFTPRRREKFIRSFEEHRARIKEICRSFGIKPFYIKDEFRADDLSRHFLDS